MHLLLYLLLAISFLLSPQFAVSGQTEGVRIFFLSSGSADSPWTKAVSKGIIEHIEQQGAPYLYFIEHLDAARFDEMHQYDIMFSYLREKFLKKEPDIFIAAGPGASNFSLFHPDLFPDSQRILIQPKMKNVGDVDLSGFTHPIKVINPTIDFSLVVAEMLRLSSPDRVFVVGDSIKPSDKLRLKQITTILRQEKTAYTVLDNMSLPSLRKRVASLPKNSAIFYTPIYREHDGKGLTPVLVMKEINTVTNSPIFSTSDSTLGFGTVGGYIYSPKKLGTMTGEAVSHLVYNQPINLTKSPFGFVYDWNEVQRWGYQNAIQPDAEIAFRPASLWQQHKGKVIFITIVIISLLSLSTAFFILNTQLKKIKRALLNERIHLEERVEERTLELSLLHEKAEKMARLDELTELDNRRSFFEKGENIHYEAQRYKRPYAIMMLDIDHFKGVNDAYGHAAGDKVIKSVAQSILSITRKSDVSARIGGEEYAVIIVEMDRFTDNDDLRTLAERLRVQIAQTVIHFEEHAISASVSIGLSTYQSQDDTINCALERADKALYTAKNTGRNKVV